jgi:hypothetical protein
MSAPDFKSLARVTVREGLQLFERLRQERKAAGDEFPNTQARFTCMAAAAIGTWMCGCTREEFLTSCARYWEIAEKLERPS